VNREDIIRMAREARFAEGMDWGHEIWEAKTGNLERFAALVAAAEREACAKVAETHQYVAGWDAQVAAAIRKRGEVKP
jgi:hypothetical protein